MTWKNRLYFADNLKILPTFADEVVDLVYLDPPFNSKATYNILFAESSGEQSAAQVSVFEDTWRWGPEAENAFDQVMTTGPEKVVDLMKAYRDFLKASDMMAYLAMMAPRLLHLHRVLKHTGSLYLHCDPTASHYLKLLLDGIFGFTNFRNEIIWRRTGSHNSPRRFGPIHDVILFYTKSDDYYFKRNFRPYLKGHVEGYFKNEDADGRKFWTNALTGAGTRKKYSGMPWKGYDPTAVGRHWAIPGKVIEALGIDEELNPQEKLDALDEAGYIEHPTKEGSKAMPTYKQYLDTSPGMPTQDIWAYQPHTRGVLYDSEEPIDFDVRWLVKQGDKERLGYPTQKPEGLLHRIINSSCPKDGLVLDPFCGCGTTVIAAERLSRQWIGIDITHLAIAQQKKRLVDSFGTDLTPYEVHGVPEDLEGAKALADHDRYEFQWWAVDEIGGTPAQDKKKGSDKGVDGFINFKDHEDKYQKIVIQVKSGSVNSQDIRDLKGVMERDKAPIGIFVTLEPPTKDMKKEAVITGFYKSPVFEDKNFPKVQILTIEQILAGIRPEYPVLMKVHSTKKAVTLGKQGMKQGKLL